MRTRRFASSRKSYLAYSLALTLTVGLSAPFTPVADAQIAPQTFSALLAATPAATSTAPVPVGAVELSPTPPNDTQAVAPNIMVTFDDSGSMQSNRMGDVPPFGTSMDWSDGPWRCANVIDPDHSTASDKLMRALAMNGVYYNPTIEYKPPMYADGTLFPDAPLDANSTPTAVWIDGMAVKRPRGGVTVDTAAGYYNNADLDKPSAGAVANLMGTATFTYPSAKTSYAAFGNTCPSNADSGTCQSNSSGTTGGGSSKKYVFYVRNYDGNTGSGTGITYYGTDLRVRGSSNNNYTAVLGELTNVNGTITKNYVTWTVTVTDTSGAPAVSNDNRWKCGTGNSAGSSSGGGDMWSGASPMDGQIHTLSDGAIVTYPNGGPYYYRLKTGVAVTLNDYGSPATSGDLDALYNKDNWEAVPVPASKYQNFANWYAYYRTRNQMARSSLARVFGALGGKTTDGGFGSSIRAAWQNLNTSDFKLPSDAIISSLVDTSDCDGASGASPSDLQGPTDTAKPPACYRSAFFNWIFQTPASGGTPSVNATSRAGKFFQRGGNADANQSTNYKTLRDPYWEAGKILPDGTQTAGAELYCRQNFHMLVTDGLFNENNVSVPDAITTLPDKTPFSFSANYTSIFQVVHSDDGAGSAEASLSDLAFYYWASNLRPDLYDPANGKFVPPYIPVKTTGIVSTSSMSSNGLNNAHVNNEIYFNPKNDPANWPHLVQYMVGLGVSGVLNYSDDTDCSISTSSDACRLRKGEINSSQAIGWPTPRDRSPGIAANIDDTWHAAIAGRGNYFNAGNPQNLVDQLSNILTSIAARSGPPNTGAVNTSVLVSGALGFNTGYSSADWSGTLQAVSVNTDGTTSTSALWSAGAILADTSKTDPTTRSVFTAKVDADGNFAGGVAFKTYTDLDTAGQTLLSGSPASADSTNDTGPTRLEYLRGDRTKESTTFRQRPKDNLLGAVIGSQVVYLGYPSSGYRNTWPSDSPEAKAAASDAADCGSTEPTTCHSYEGFVKDHLDRTPTVYVGANDGMLHAFDASEYEDTSAKPSVIKPTADAGKELFAYVPRSAYENLGNLTLKDNFKFKPTVDGLLVTRDVFFSATTTTPVATTKGWHTILVGGLRLGGRGIYALDITDPTAMAADKVLWEFNAGMPDVASSTDGPGGSPANLGYTYGQPNIGRLNNGKWVVLVPGGYFPDCSKAPFTAANCASPTAASNKFSSLFVLDAQTGKLIREIRTSDSVDSGDVFSHGLSSPVLGDYNDNQIDDVAFAGDLDGNLWRFDLTSADPADWKVTLAYQPATDGAQPITSMPRLFADPATNKFIVVFGTGKYLGAGDNTSGSAATQAVYGIRDAGSIVKIADLVQQTLSEKTADDGKTLARGMTNYPVGTDKKGWYFTLGPSTSSAGERVVVTPGALFDTGRAVIQTLIPGTNDPCDASIQGAVMVVNAATGGSGGGLSGPSVTGWGGKNNGDTSVVGGRVNDPRTSGSVPLVTKIGGGTVLIPGLKLTGSGGVLNINDAVWRRRSWRELRND